MLDERPRPMTQPRDGRRRGSLALRISLLVTAACAITAVIAGALSINLIRAADTRTARQSLSRVADATQATADLGVSAQASQARARRTLQALKIQSVTIASNGSLTTESALARASVTSVDTAKLLSGQSVSAIRRVDGGQVVVEGRPTRAGAIVLVQRRADATGAGDQAIRRVVLALLIGAAAAIVLGLWVARRIARPLRRTAEAAQALATGRRDVTVPADGPTEVAEVGEAVNSLAAALAHSEARQRDFLLSVSHDLRTPLTALSGFAESLADGVVPQDQTAEVGSVMLGEAQRLTRLVGDLLDLARLGATEFRLDFAALDLVALAQAAARVWADRCNQAGVEFRLEAPASPLWCWSDAARLRQVLDGLFDNALRVTPVGAPIVLAVGQLDDVRVIAEVRDGGPGLTDDDLSVAFDGSALYERYRGVRQVGTGFGLAIVYGLVGRLGGTVQAGHSKEGGARFTVFLPVR
jgi:two-component system, OmpR family, sensor kinase